MFNSQDQEIKTMKSSQIPIRHRRPRQPLLRRLATTTKEPSETHPSASLLIVTSSRRDTTLRQRTPHAPHASVGIRIRGASAVVADELGSRGRACASLRAAAVGFHCWGEVFGAGGGNGEGWAVGCAAAACGGGGGRRFYGSVCWRCEVGRDGALGEMRRDGALGDIFGCGFCVLVGGRVGFPAH